MGKDSQAGLERVTMHPYYGTMLDEVEKICWPEPSFSWPKPDGGIPHQQFKWLDRFAWEGDSLLDIGAALGHVSRYFHALVPEGKIVCVEPNPVSFIHLSERLPSVARAIQAAIWSRHGESLQFTMDPLEAQSTQLGPEGGFLDVPPERGLHFDTPCPLMIPTVTIDSIAERYGIATLVKLDCEGSELEAIRGGSETLSRSRVVMVETLESRLRSRGITREDIHDALVGLGFSNFEPAPPDGGGESDWVYWRD